MSEEYLVSSTALEDLEYRLNQVPYQGIPTGTLISGFLLVELYLGKSDFSFKGKLTDIVFRSYIKYYGPKWQRMNKNQTHSEYSNYIGRHLFTITDNRSNFKGLVTPILNCLKKDKYVVFANQDTLDPSLLNFISYNDIPSITLSDWHQRLTPYFIKWDIVINNWIKDHQIRKWVKYKIINNLYSQTLLFESLSCFLKMIKPISITTEYDRYWFSSALIAAGNSLQIPTYTLMHGVVNNSIGYVPLLANKIIVWGDRQKEQLLAYGLDPNNIIVNGAPQLSEKILADKVMIRSQLGITDSKPVVVFGSCNISVVDMRNLMNIFCQSFNDQDFFHAFVKLHPSETKEFYSEQISMYKNIKFCDTKELAFEDSFAIADVICVYNSAYGTDALIKDVPVVVIDINIAKAGNAAELIANGIPAASTPSQVFDTCKRVLSDHAYLEQMQGHMNKYRKDYCFAFSTEAAALYAKTICNNINN